MLRNMLRIRATVVFVAALAAGAGAAAADLGPLEPIADLHRAVHESLGLPEPLIVRLLEGGLPHEELPVVGLISSRAGVAPVRVVELHRGGLSYLEIAHRYELGPEVFYVPFDRDPGPPYGKAWGYYRKTPRAEWRTIRLSDRQIVHLANVRLLADHYRVPPTRIVELHHHADGYAAIHRELRRGSDKGKSPGKAVSRDPGQSGRSRGVAEHGGGPGKSRGKAKKAKGDPPR